MSEEQRSNHSSFILGLFLILLGALILLIQFGQLNWENFWPFLILTIGVLFMLGFLVDRKKFGLLMPGTILLIIGSLFVSLNYSEWRYMEHLWPTFILAPGIGFFLMYVFGPANNRLWIPGSILIVLAMIFYAQVWQFFRYWPVLLILLGIYLLLNPMKDRVRKENDFSGDNSSQL